MTAPAEETTELNCPLDSEGLLLGDAVVMLRIAMRLTQAELAERAGLAPATVSDVEQGNSPKCETLEALADALGEPSESLAILTPGRSLPRMSLSRSDANPLLVEAGEPGSWTWHSLDYDDDPWARELCECLYSEGREMSAEQIGAYFGRSRSWAQDQVERALCKVSRLPAFKDIEDWL